MRGLVEQSVIKSEDEMYSNPILQKDIIKESVPGSIRKAEHFLPMLRKLIVYLKKMLSSTQLKTLSPLSLVYELQE